MVWNPKLAVGVAFLDSRHIWKCSFYLIKSQVSSLFCSYLYVARIELAVGSPPYPGIIQIPKSVLDEIGNYLDYQFVSPVLT